MGQSIRVRLNGRRDDFLHDVKLWGIWKTMEKYGFKDYLGVKRYIEEETGNETFGLRPQFDSLAGTTGNNVLQKFVQEFACYVLKAEARSKEKEQLIQILTQKLAYYEGKDVETVQTELVSLIESLQAIA